MRIESVAKLGAAHFLENEKFPSPTSSFNDHMSIWNWLPYKISLKIEQFSSLNWSKFKLCIIKVLEGLIYLSHFEILNVSWYYSDQWILILLTTLKNLKIIIALYLASCHISNSSNVWFFLKMGPLLGARRPGAMGYIYNMLIIWQSYTAHIWVNDWRKRINWQLIWDEWQEEKKDTKLVPRAATDLVRQLKIWNFHD